LTLDPSNVGNRPLTEALVRTQISAGYSVLYVDKDLKLVEAREGDVTLVGASERTASSKTMEILVHGRIVYCMATGRITDQYYRERADKKDSDPARWSRPFAEFDQILADHKGARIDSEKGLRYWHKKPERVLRSKPDKTEAMFHQELYWWLSHYVSDRLDVIAEPFAHGQPKVDIAVITPDGSFVIEIKWLGRNEAGDSHGQERVDQGLAQVKLYLESKKEYVFGYLVVYDGRSILVHCAERHKWNASHKHDYCHAPKYIFLESESPSVTAAKVGKR
jgi:hypothetical protein